MPADGHRLRSAHRRAPAAFPVALTALLAALLGAAGALAQEAPQMVRIPGGVYPLGSGEAGPSARPAHTVRLAPFLIDRTEVTNAQFAAFLNTLDARPVRDVPPSRATPDDVTGPDAGLLFERGALAPDDRPLYALGDNEARIAVRGGRFAPQPGFGEHPVNEVTWDAARRYCAWRGARLPTEAEWEAAARGTEGRRYPWGGAPPTPQRAVYGRRSNDTEPVGRRSAGATPEGVHDLAGNVAEWTSTLFRPYPYDPDDGREHPTAPGERVTRGGDHVFDSEPAKLTGWFRAGFSRQFNRGHRHIGFRCAKDG